MDHPVARAVAEGSQHEAVASARQRLDHLKETIGEHHPDYATGLNQVARLLIMQGDPEGAEPLLRQALDVRKETLGEDHLDYATSLSSLAGLIWARGDLEGAEPLLRQALEVRATVLGTKHPKTAVSLNSLEQLLKAKREWAGTERRPVDPVPKHVVAAPKTRPVAADAPAAADPVSAPTPPVAVKPTPPVENGPAPRAPEPAASVTSVSNEPAAPAVVNRPEPSRPDDPARDDLTRELDGLTSTFAELGKRLTEAAERLKNSGSLPPESLAEAMADSGRGFATLRAEVLRRADALSVAPAPPEIASLQEIAALLPVLAEAEAQRGRFNEIRRLAVSALDRVLTIAHSGQAEFPPLQECQARARELQTAIADAPPSALPADAAALAEGEHPFAQLLALVDSSEHLSNELWHEAVDVVGEAFGKPLAVAAARARLVQPATAQAGNGS